MKKSKVTRSLLAAVSVVALSAVMYGCSGGVSQSEADRQAAEAAAEAKAAAEAAAAAAAAEAAAQAERDKQAALEEERRKAAEAEEARLAQIQDARDAIAAAETAGAAQAAKDAVDDIATATEAAGLQAAVDERKEALAMMGRAGDQNTALMNAADDIDTSDLATQAAIDAAEDAIDALKAAIAAAVDVDDTSMYQTQVNAAEEAVAAAQSRLDHAAQTEVLSDAVTDLQAIDLGDLSTQAKIDAAEDAIAALRSALEAATELSDAEKAAAMTELATANRTVMTAQGRVDTASQMTALSEAVDALGMIDLDDLMTQEQIDEAVEAITAVDLALAAATDLSAADKLDATVDVTVAKRKVDRAEETLDDNIGDQRKALTNAGKALAAIDTSEDGLTDADAINEARAAVAKLKEALDGATHLSEADKAKYQSQYKDADEAVKTAATGMDRDGRMTAQRTAITNAVTMARTAVNGVKNTSTDTEVSAADQAITDLEDAIAGAEDLPEGDTDVASARGTLATLKAQLNTAKTARTAYLATKADEDMEAMTKLGKALHAALAGPATTNTALDNIAPPTLATAGLTVNAAAGAGELEAGDDPGDVVLKAGDSAGSLDGWAGTDYAHTDTGTKVVNEARVYTNKGPDGSQPFSNTETNGKYLLITAAGATQGYVLLGDTTSGQESPVTRASAAAFTHSGTQTHQTPSQRDAFYTPGTYDGAPGVFRCAGTNCSSTNDGEGNVTSLGGTWHFKPNAGAMVSAPDAHYLYYGWWVSKDDEGNPTAASAFVGRVGTDAPITDGLDAGWSGSYTTTAGSETRSGSATYAGNAAGKFAVDNPLDGTGNGGHFTADASLSAKFSGTGIGITGTINKFRLNDGSEDPGWSVALHRADFGSNGAFATPTTNDTATEADETKGTTWSIDGNSAARTGTWSGTMYDEKPGDPSATGPGDGSNIPTTVTGTFYSEFSSIGRMVGAFGADKQ